MTGRSKFEVSKFDGHGNFGLWQTRVKNLLAQQGIQKGLRAEKPKGMEDDDWQDVPERAARTIRLCLADEVMYHVMHLKSVDEIWKKLESQFMSKTLTTKLYLKERLYGLKMQEGTDLGQHVNIFNQVVTDLTSLEVKIEDEDKAMILLCSLSPSYKHMVTTLTYGKETIKTEEITSALLAHNQWKQKSGESSSQSDSLYVKGNQDRGRRQVRDNSGNRNFRSKSRYKSKGRKTVTCYKCKEQGHFKRDCPKWKKQTVDMSSKSANVVQNEESDCSDGDVIYFDCAMQIRYMWSWNLFQQFLIRERVRLLPDDVDHDVSDTTDVSDSYKLARDRVRRTNIQAPVMFGYEDMVAFALMITSVDPCLLSQEFEMKDLGAAKKILGMEIHKDRGSKKLWLSQKGYVEKVLQRFAMNEAKSVGTPLANHFKLSVDMCPKSDKELRIWWRYLMPVLLDV
ncbi:Probable prolyl 4-hydroxylase 11 [Striga hermonthica]|uniref:Probable prolyl 4-hydroxylase 11 n=1 Tax=Striga hermonthica TaxID=68872 RepID=A0A9N7NWS7_STRHE|nr:Probable prolyl 4-hydroxylase 11 [Striga hermonthica]